VGGRGPSCIALAPRRESALAPRRVPEVKPGPIVWRPETTAIVAGAPQVPANAIGESGRSIAYPPA
jgi:hypothetical protein